MRFVEGFLQVVTQLSAAGCGLGLTVLDIQYVLLFIVLHVTSRIGITGKCSCSVAMLLRLVAAAAAAAATLKPDKESRLRGHNPGDSERDYEYCDRNWKRCGSETNGTNGTPGGDQRVSILIISEATLSS